MIQFTYKQDKHEWETANSTSPLSLFYGVTPIPLIAKNTTAELTLITWENYFHLEDRM